MKKTVFFLLLFFIFSSFLCFSQDGGNPLRIPIPRIGLNIEESNNPQDIALSLQILFLLSILTLAPSIVVLMTSFLRIAIVFDFLKKALSLQQMPPNQVLFGLALFMTFFIMWPTFERINESAIRPFIDQENTPVEDRIDLDQFYERFLGPIREFMFKQTDPNYIGFFMNMRDLDAPNDYDDVPTYVIIPAFVINELTVGFKIGILLFIPFIVIDMVIASTLMAMGMIMLPPVMISLPFKLMLFIMLDGWRLLTQGLFESFIK